MFFCRRPVVVRRDIRGNPQAAPVSHDTPARRRRQLLTQRAQSQDEEQREDVRRRVIPAGAPRSALGLLAILLAPSQLVEKCSRGNRRPRRSVCRSVCREPDMVSQTPLMAAAQWGHLPLPASVKPLMLAVKNLPCRPCYHCHSGSAIRRQGTIPNIKRWLGV